jgi:hypothetical protein
VVVAAEAGTDDQEQQHCGGAEGGDGQGAGRLCVGGQVVVGEGAQASEDGAVEGQQ